MNNELVRSCAGNQEGLKEEHTTFNFSLPLPLRGGEAEKGIAKPLQPKVIYKNPQI